MGSLQYCQKSKDMLHELQRGDWIPEFNNNGMRQVIDEMNALYGLIKAEIGSGRDVTAGEIASSLFLYKACIQRNKRCMLAYLKYRMEAVSDLRWRYGSTIPADMKAKLCFDEVNYFEKYDDLLSSYMKGVDMDLTSDMQPPKSLYIEIRVLKDCGEVFTDSGTVILDKGTTHFLRRSDVEHFIRQGVIEQIS